MIKPFNDFQKRIYMTPDDELPELELRKPVIAIDVETGGFSPSENALLQFGACILGSGSGDFKAGFSGTILPPKDVYDRTVTAGAVAVNGLTYDILKEKGKPAQEVYADFVAWVVDNKVNPDWLYIGQNPGFDLKFLRYYVPGFFSERKLEFTKENAFNIMDLYSILETRGVVPYIVYEKGVPGSGKTGKNISLALGVDPEPDVHDAFEGAAVVVRNFKRIARLLKYSN